MENIDIEKLSDEEIRSKFGPLADSVIAFKRKYEKNAAELAEVHRTLEEAFNSDDQHRFRLLKQLLERFDATAQAVLSEDAESGGEIAAGADEDYSDGETERKKGKRGRKKGTRNLDGFDPGLVADAETVILGTPTPDTKPTVFYKLKVVPAVVRLTRYEYYPDGEMPDQYGMSLLTPSFAAYAATRKFVFGMPLYRIETLLRERGTPVSRDQLARYCMLAADDLRPIAERINEVLLSAPRTHVIHADETPLDVIRMEKEDGDGKTVYSKKKGRMFVYTTCRWEDHIAAVYRFEPDRKADRIQDHLAKFTGTVVCDDYPGYDKASRLSDGRLGIARCWFHWRKRFNETALVAKDALKHQDGGKAASYADSVLATMERLFDIEKECRGLTAEEVLKIRQKKSKPIVDALFSRLKADLPKMKDPILSDVRYGLKLESQLRMFLDDPYIDMTNNICERAVKDMVMSRKNFLFSFSQSGAEANGILMTVLRTARLNSLDPEKYMAYVLGRVATTPLSGIDTLLPWSETLPKELKGTKELPEDLDELLKKK